MNRQDYLRQRYVWTSGETVVSTKPAAKVSRPPARTPSLAARVQLSRQRLVNQAEPEEERTEEVEPEPVEPPVVGEEPE